jgi:hypothetical protein
MDAAKTSCGLHHNITADRHMSLIWHFAPPNAMSGCDLQFAG